MSTLIDGVGCAGSSQRFHRRVQGCPASGRRGDAGSVDCESLRDRRPHTLLPRVTTAIDPARPRSIAAPLQSVARGDVSDNFGLRSPAQAEPESSSPDLAAFVIGCGRCRSVLAHTTP